jgi:hypothetical protein
MTRFSFISLAITLLVASSSSSSTKENVELFNVENYNVDQNEVDDLIEFDLDDDSVYDGPRNLGTIDNERFNINFGYGTSLTKAQKQGFIDARSKWSSIITKDSAASACLKAGATLCGYRFAKATCIDDLFIGVRIKKMDGVGKIAGSAGPCAVDDTGKVRMGLMTFDVEDANNLIKNGAWESTILHEMGHVLGLGTLWEYEQLITSRVLPPPFLYQGENGNAGLSEIVGSDSKIIIEDLGGVGTARAHWKELVYDGELMTGYLEPKGKKMPLSLMTVRALQDLGYVVDVTKADPYTKPGRRLRGTDADDQKIPVGNDILDLPVVQLRDDIIRTKPGREQEHNEARERYAEKRRNGRNLSAPAE